MNWLATFGGVIRALLAAAGGWAVGRGYIDEGSATELTGAATIAATAIWSAVQKAKAAKELKKAESEPAKR